MSATLTTEATAPATIESLLQRLKAREIKIPRPNEVRDYLTRYPDVIQLTSRVCDMTLVDFEGIAELSLELYIDPEIDDQYLTLYVRQDTFDQTTRDKIERIQDDYEFELAGLSGWLHIIRDHRGPEEG